MPAQVDRTITIAASGSNSAAFGTGQATRGSFQIPSAFTGTAVTVQGSWDGTNFTNIVAEGNEANPITVSTNGTYAFPVKTFNFKNIRLVSNDTEAAARTINVFTRD